MSKPKRPLPKAPSLLSGEQRINKVLAAAGLGSRRQVDELIEQGRVEIDGKTVTQVGIKVDPAQVTISVDGESLKRHKPIYYALNKPEGVLCTNRDPEGRPRVTDMVPNQVRLFPVGRLDASSTGLILLTNDGELAQRLAHPKHGIPKRYAVVVVGQVENDSLRRLQRGIHLAEGRAKVDDAKIKRLRKGCTEIEITLSEGKNREIRRVLARLGHKVVSLQRIAIGPLKLADMPEGAYRPLSNDEVRALYHSVEEIKRERKAERKARKQLRVETNPSAEAADRRVDRATHGKIDSLPPLSQNPFRTEEDDESEDEFGDESVLVRDDSWGDDDELPQFGLRPGSVIGEDEEVEEFEPAPSERGPRGEGRVRSGRRGNVGRKQSKKSGSRPARNVARSSDQGQGNDAEPYDSQRLPSGSKRRWKGARSASRSAAASSGDNQSVGSPKKKSFGGKRSDGGRGGRSKKGAGVKAGKTFRPKGAGKKHAGKKRPSNRRGGPKK